MTDAQLFATARTCRCGCGQVPKSSGGQFARGHNLHRGPEPLRAEQSPSRCRTCKAVLERPPSVRGVYCDQDCKAAYQRKRRDPKLRLGQFISGHLDNSGLSMTMFASSIGVTRQQLVDLLDDRLPSQRLVDSLKVIYGADIPPTETANAQWKETYRALLQTYGHLGRTSEASRKGAAKRSGPRDPSVGEHIKESFATSARREVWREWAKSTTGRAMQSLIRHLGHDRSPSRSTIRNWARTTGSGLGISEQSTLSLWLPMLQARELWPKGGAPAKENRCRLIRELRVPGGAEGAPFWEEAVEHVRELEGIAGLTAESLRDWWKKHRRRCVQAGQGGKTQFKVGAEMAVISPPQQTTRRYMLGGTGH